MQTVNATVLRNNLSGAVNTINKNKDYLLVAKRGKVVSALVNIDFFEDLLALSNKKYLASIKKAREEYKKGQVFPHEDVFGEI